MTERYVFGTPFDTEAVLDKPAASPESALGHGLKLSADKKKVSYDLDKDDVIYGLGESLHGMNKRGFVYKTFNTDQTKHNEDQYSLYGSHTFILIEGAKGSLGIFTDYPGLVTYDLGFTDKDVLTITAEEADYEMYVITGKSGLEIITEFRKLIGKSYKAPLWAFGYGQSRWGYKCEDDIREVVRRHKENNLPLDAVYMDIDYMDNYKDFTLNPEAFPKFKEFVDEMKAQHIHLLPNVDAAIKIEDGYDMYEEGVKENYYCKDENGEDFIMAAWPGKSVLPDFLRPEVRRWFGLKYRFFTDAGVDGFWNDMNEPALFYSLKGLKETAEEISHLKDKTDTLDLYSLWHYLDTMNALANKPEDYRSFYHEPEGKKIRHDRVHNLYGYNMARAASEVFEEIAPEMETLIFSRASYIGSHRYAGIWTGDNSSFYSHIELILHQLPNLNMCGYLYVGADTGGFAFHTSENLLKRFMQVSLFTPLFRNHCALGCREQEIYRFKDIDAFRNLLNLRYALIPYLYKSYVDSIENNKLMFTPIGLAFPEDKEARHIEDQLLVGDDLMIAPVYKANASGRDVYLPEDMTLYLMKSDKDFTKTELSKGHHFINVDIDEVPIFVRKGKSLTLGKPAMSTAELE
ncbi:MAG: alpha-glucosidase [Lachnospiraceae bacterium]|nr:alpha-glucosidase [Lachnospiraceae bacterium]